MVHGNNTWHTANTRDDHEINDFTEFLMKILRGTISVAEASDKPLTTCDVREATWNSKTSCMADTRCGSYSQDVASFVHKIIAWAKGLTCRDVAPVDLGDRCRPMTTKMVL